MSSEEPVESIQVAVRLKRPLYNRVIARQQDAKRKTGMEPTVSEVVRMLIERGLETKR